MEAESMGAQGKSRREFFRLMALGAVSTAVPGCATRFRIPAPRPPSGKPNILLIFTDDQGTLDANCYGSKDLYTPHMDGLAKSGIRLTQAYSHIVCCPARAPLLTGRHPQRGNVNEWTPCHPDRNHPFGKGPNMSLEEVTLAEVLRDNDYRTALFGKWHLGATPGYGPNEQGFDEFFGHLGGFIDNYTHEFLHGDDFHDLYRNQTEVFENGKYFPDLVVRESHRFLEENRDRPFFMYVALNVPHYPEQADPKFAEMYEDLPMPRRSYAAMISTVDDRIGRIINKIENLGLSDNTLIIWMSDNGHSTEGYYPPGKQPPGYYSAHGGGGNTGRWRGAKESFLEGGIRVPAVMSLPGRIRAGEVRDQAIINADFFPTILELCGIPLPDRPIDGKSLWPLLRSAGAPSPHKVLYWQWKDMWAVREGDWKLIVNGLDTTGGYSAHPQRPHKLESPFLANLADEPPEWKNFADERPDVVKRLTRLHDEWAREVTKSE
jgi:arylsulfatase A-like enzyme